MINDWQWIIWATLGDPSKGGGAEGPPRHGDVAKKLARFSVRVRALIAFALAH